MSTSTASHGTDGSGIIPVVVRFVPYDQWCTTHIALSWTISQVKTWILAKCFHDSDTLRILSLSLNAAAKAKDRNQPKRSVSPITFASVRMNKQQYAESLYDINLHRFDDLDDDMYGDDTYLGDSDDNGNRIHPDRHPRSYNPYIAHPRGTENRVYSPPSSHPSISPKNSVSNIQPEDYSLLSFSTLHILEDRYPVSWYNIHPYELLELHPSGTIIRLHRNLPANTAIFGSIPTNPRTRLIGNDKPGLLSKDGLPSLEHALGLYDYVQPYFQAPVKAFRIIQSDSHRSSQGTRASSPTKEEFPPSSSAASSQSKAGRLLKHTRPNIHEINISHSAHGESLPADSLTSPPDLTSDGKGVGTTNDQNSYSKVSAIQLTGAKRKGLGSPDVARNKLVWQDRWLVIREGVLSLCDNKEDIRTPSHSSYLSTLTALRGVEHLMTNPSLVGIMTESSRRNPVSMKKRIVCAKFQDIGRKESSAGFTEREFEESEGKGKRTPHTTGLDEDTAHPHPSSSMGSRNKESCVWLIIDMLNEAAFDNIVRVLHRTAPTNVASAFLNDGHPGSSQSPFSFTTNDSPGSIHNRSSISSLRQSFQTASSGSEHLESMIRSTPSLSPLPTAVTPESPRFRLSIETSSAALRFLPRHRGTSKQSYESFITPYMTYLDRRMDIVMKARRAGVGDVGNGMQFLLCGYADQQEDDIGKDKTTIGLNTPKRARRRDFDSPKTAKVTSEAEDGVASIDGDSESESWDDSLGPHRSNEQESSENEWEGWQQDIARQWNSVAEEPEFNFSPIHQVRFSDHHDSGEENGSVRRRVYSDVHRSLQKPLAMSDLSAAMSDGRDVSLFSPLEWMSGSVTSSTVSVGRTSARKRSSTVTASPQKKDTKEKTQPAKNKEKELLGRSRPPSLHIHPPISKPEEGPETSLGNGTTKRKPRSRPTSILRTHNAMDFDHLPTSPKPDQDHAPSQLTVPANTTGPSGNSGSHGDGVVRTKSKRIPTLNGIVRGVSTAVKSKTKGVL